MILRCVVFLVALLQGVALAHADTGERRVALVLANAAYQHLTPLQNAVHDGTALAQALQRLDFEVVEGLDLSHQTMIEAVRSFAEHAKDAEIGLIFYAGHGIQVSGENYLVPVDANPATAADLAFEALKVSDMMLQLQGRLSTLLVFLDACRDNPLPLSKASTDQQTRSLNSAQGLAPVRAGVGSFIVYATEPNRVAFDGVGDHSPFTGALLEHIETPDLEIREMMTHVRRAVIELTDQQQVPWDHSALLGPVYLKPEGIAAPPPVALSTIDADAVFWDTLQRINEPALQQAALKIYRDAFPSGRFSNLAEIKLASFVPGRDAAPQEPAPTPQQATPSVFTSTEVTDFLYWRDVNRDFARGEAAERYLQLYPSGRFAEEAFAQLVADPGTTPLAVPPEQGPTIEVIAGGGPQPLALQLPTVDQTAVDVVIKDVPAGRLTLAGGRPIGQGDRLPLSEMSGLLLEPPLDDYGSIGSIMLGIESAIAPIEWEVPVSVRPHDCDLMASDPLDPNRISVGIHFLDDLYSKEDRTLRANAAVLVCLRGASDYPQIERFKANLGRAYIGLGQYEEARSWLEPLAEKGNVLAQNQMGLMLKNGWGLATDYDQAAQYFLAAAEAGHVGAQHDIAFAYGDGRGMPKDDAKMAAWMQKASESGYHRAQYNMGRIYVWGRGVERDLDAALTLFKQAAAQGFKPAVFEIASLYEKGEGVPANPERARNLYRSAMEAHPPAELAYGRMLAFGEGGPRLFVEGVYYIAKAAGADDERTAKVAGELFAKLPRKDLLSMVQEGLAAKGFDPGTPDGLMGPGTRQAIGAFRASIGLGPQDAVTPDLILALVSLTEPNR